MGGELAKGARAVQGAGRERERGQRHAGSEVQVFSFKFQVSCQSPDARSVVEGRVPSPGEDLEAPLQVGVPSGQIPVSRIGKCAAWGHAAYRKELKAGCLHPAKTWRRRAGATGRSSEFSVSSFKSCEAPGGGTRPSRGRVFGFKSQARNLNLQTSNFPGGQSSSLRRRASSSRSWRATRNLVT